ncbi:MAG TPA: hypothetical protein VJ565_01420 [Dehalococcoidia bacterium]|nr:hypothetical protein [Dehalococcoidia bacterium]
MEKTVKMTLGKATKGTYVYEEEVGDQPPVVRTLYIQKWALGSDPPKEIQVTIRG